MIIVAPSARDAETAMLLRPANPLSPFGKRLHLFPSWEPLPFENLSPHSDDLAARLEGLDKLAEEPGLFRQFACRPDAESDSKRCAQRVLRLSRRRPGAVGIIDPPLVEWGFQTYPLVEDRGDFSIRGSSNP